MLRRTHFIVIALVTALIGFVSLPVAAQSGRTFYIDYSSGSNSNPGTKASPWKSHPYMACGSAPSYSHIAGDHFIFKGGVTWPAACFEMSILAGGTSSAQDYYGVDTTWYAGGSFARPLFDLNYTVPAGNHVIVAGSSFPGYVTFDNLEIAHQGLSLNIYASDDAYNFVAVTSSMPGVLIENGYIHDWITNTNVAGLPSTATWPYSAGTIFDGSNRITLDHTTISDAAGWVYNGATKVVGGFGGACVNCGEVKNSTFHDNGAGCFTTPSCHDNEFYNYDYQFIFDLCSCRPHSQIIEDDYTAETGNVVVYNNYLHDNTNVGVSIYVPYHSEIYNNVLVNTSQFILLGNYAQSDSSAYVGHVFNNTVDCSNGGNCIAEDTKGTALGTLYMRNNQWITNGTPTCFGGSCSAIATLIQSNNLTMSTTTATAQGYTASDEYAPTSGSGATVNAAMNLTSSCSGGLEALCADRLGNQRLTSWDVGAYEFGGAQSSKPNPPTGLTASVQ